MVGQIRVLHVDDEPGSGETGGERLQRADDHIVVETAGDASEGLERLDDDVDCVVSGYELPDTDGVEFLESVRETRPDLPFILFTGEGSEAVASDAISAGVTDYLRKEGGTGQYAALADRIGDAVVARRSTRESERRHHRLEQVLKTVPACVVRVDTDGQFTYANDRAEEVLGLDPEAVPGRTYNDPAWDITDLDGNPIPDEELPFRQVRDSGEPLYGFRHTVTWPDGTRKALLVNGAPLFDEDGSVESTVFALTDITEHLERERALERSEQRYRTLAENFPNGAVLVFDTDLRYRRAHGEGFEEGALDPDAVEGAHVEEVFDGEVLERKRAMYEATLQGESLRTEMEFEDRVYRVYTIPITDDDGDVFGGIVMTQDVTERRRRERRLERQNERLENFAGIVAHDLRNPLNVAEGQLELAREEFDGDHLAEVGEMLDRSQRLIDDLLALARGGDVVSDPGAVDLGEVAEACWRAVDTGEATLVAGTDARVRADRGRLQQLLENLVRNAVEHGGPAVTVEVGELDDGAGFYVADDGRGIAEPDRGAVFDSDYSSDEGGGLGLAIVKEIADAHGWDVRVTGSDGGGARFEFRGVERA